MAQTSLTFSLNFTLFDDGDDDVDDNDNDDNVDDDDDAADDDNVCGDDDDNECDYDFDVYDTMNDHAH